MGSLITVKGKKQEALYTTTVNRLALDDELCIYAIADFSAKNGVRYPSCEIRHKVNISEFSAINLDELAKN